MSKIQDQRAEIERQRRLLRAELGRVEADMVILQAGCNHEHAFNTSHTGEKCRDCPDCGKCGLPRA